MSDATFLPPDLGSFCRLDELGLQVVGQRLEPGRAVLAWRVVEPTSSPGGVPLRMPGCAARQRDPAAGARTAGVAPDDVADHVRRYRCTGCGHVSRQDTSRAAEPRAKLSRRALRWALEGIVCQHLTVARVAEGLGVSWNTANDAVLAEGRRVLIEDPHRFDGVRVIGVDEHCWRHTIRKLGRTLKQRATDILALFDRPGTSNGPTEAINGRLEHLRGSALGFRNLTDSGT